MVSPGSLRKSQSWQAGNAGTPASAGQTKTLTQVGTPTTKEGIAQPRNPFFAEIADMKWGFFLLIGFPALVFSQANASNLCGSITCSFSGMVTDEQGTPLEWAIVLLKEKSRVVSACRTDSLGNYQLSGRVKHLRKATLTFSYLWVKEVKAVFQEAERVNVVLKCEHTDDYGIPIYMPVGESQHIESLDQIWPFNRRITD